MAAPLPSRATAPPPPLLPPPSPPPSRSSCISLGHCTGAAHLARMLRSLMVFWIREKVAAALAESEASEAAHSAAAADVEEGRAEGAEGGVAGSAKVSAAAAEAGAGEAAAAESPFVLSPSPGYGNRWVISERMKRRRR